MCVRDHFDFMCPRVFFLFFLNNMVSTLVMTGLGMRREVSGNRYLANHLHSITGVHK